ncbi:hypothetical protein V2J09_015137 [Rumex salicifolius]
MPTFVPLLRFGGTLLLVPKEYRALVGGLQYLNLTRPNVAFATNKLSQFMQHPTDDQGALKCVLRYLDGTLHLGIHITKAPSLNFHAFSDADWARDRDDYRSTSGYLLYFGSTPISWSSRKQRSIARSSTKAEYKALADTTS